MTVVITPGRRYSECGDYSSATSDRANTISGGESGAVAIITAL